MKISHSAREKYTLCPRKYKLHYVDRLRGPLIPSPLFFGSALDEGFSHLLLSKKVNLTEEELTQQLTRTAEEVFYQKMLEIQHNGETVQLKQNPFADYYTSDFSSELLNNSHLESLQSLEPNYKLIDFIDFHFQCKEQLRAKKKLQPDERLLYNFISWTSLVEKGKLMLSAYNRDIVPQIEEVHSLQKRISLSNPDGDEIVGLIDFTASFKDQPGVKYVMDNKTSSEPYKADSVEQSEQLSTYCEAEGLKTAGYAVVQKKLFKREPFIRTQLIKGEIPEKTFEKTLDSFEKTCYSIESGQFEQNWNSCFAFGRMCEYFKLCKYDDKTDLVKLPEKT
jgi:hypothetical protein